AAAIQHDAAAAETVGGAEAQGTAADRHDAGEVRIVTRDGKRTGAHLAQAPVTRECIVVHDVQTAFAEVEGGAAAPMQLHQAALRLTRIGTASAASRSRRLPVATRQADAGQRQAAAIAYEDRAAQGGAAAAIGDKSSAPLATEPNTD